MKIVLNGGPYDGTETEMDGDHPKVYCGIKGDGYIRVYVRQSLGKYTYQKTVKASDYKGDEGEF